MTSHPSGTGLILGTYALNDSNVKFYDSKILGGAVGVTYARHAPNPRLMVSSLFPLKRAFGSV